MPSSNPAALLPILFCAACASSPTSVAPVARAAPVPAVVERSPVDPHAAAIDAVFAKSIADVSPGCAVGVFRAGELVFERGYGYASLELGAEIDPSTRFQVASVTKQFTAASILLLAGDGKLALADDIRKYLPEFPKYAETITIDHLLHHTSGIRNGYTLLAQEGHDTPGDIVKPDDALWLLFRQRGVNWAPGIRFDYMSGNYWLLAEIVRRVSGESLAAFAKHRIFEPLAMTDTLIKDDHESVLLRAASGYTGSRDEGPKVYKSAAIQMEIVGGIGLVTTVRDLARWDSDFYVPNVGGQALLAGLRTHVKLRDGTVLPEAMGLVIEVVGGHTRESYEGITTGFHAFIARYPDERLGIAVLCNDTNLNARVFSEEVAAVYLPATKAVSAADASGHDTEPPLPAIDPRIAGVYVDRVSSALRSFFVKAGDLFMNAEPSSDQGARLVRVAEREFVAGGVAHYVFHPPAAGAPASVTRVAPGEPPSAFARVEMIGSLGASELHAYEGRFTSDEVARDWELVLKDGKLFGRPWGGSTPGEPMIPLTRDLFRRGDEALLFERDKRGKVTGFVFNAAPDALGIRYTRHL
jgi:CubicO group peptidase (beta-lactamase class C family)